MMRAQAVALTLSTVDFLARLDCAPFHRQASALLQTTGVGMHVVLSTESGQHIVNTLLPFGEHLPQQEILTKSTAYSPAESLPFSKYRSARCTPPASRVFG